MNPTAGLVIRGLGLEWVGYRWSERSISPHRRPAKQAATELPASLTVPMAFGANAGSAIGVHQNG